MRIEEKRVDGPDLERTAEQQETLLAEKKDADLPELAGEEVRDTDGGRKDQLLGLMRMIFEDKDVEIEQLALPQRETIALGALHSAVHGRRTNHETFLFAADRRSLLEQALAVLQPNLIESLDPQLAAMSADLRRLTHHVTQLRETLMVLEDGQDEIMAVRPKHLAGQTVGLPVDPDVDPDAPKTSTLSSGPEAKREDRASTLSKGPEVKREDRASTLSRGPEVKRETPPTSLGDPAEIEEAARTPWWRRATPK